MDIEVGKTYRVMISDCCVEGDFVSVLTKAQRYDDNEQPYPVNTNEYGTEAFFANGVRLELMNGVSLEEVSRAEHE